MPEEHIVNSIQSDLFLSTVEIEQNLDTSSKYGLDEDEARTRLEDKGINIPTRGRKPSELLKLVRNLIGLHNGPLWFAAGLCILVYGTEVYFVEHDLEVKPDNLYIGGGLIVFVFAFGIFSYYMEAKCEYYLESGREFMSRYATVIREGVPREVFQEHLVVGDLVSFRQGDEISADIKLVECAGVRVNVDMLTEREKRYYTRLYDTADRLFHTGDIIFRSSFILSGHGKGVVTRTRQYYLSGSRHNHEPVIESSQWKRHTLNPLTVELKVSLHYLSMIAISISVIYAVSSLLVGYSWLQAVMFFIALYVGIITEALLPTFNVAKTQLAKELASKSCYIKNIESLETLGTTTIICTNKTGVITQNRMIVAQIWIDNQLMASYEFMRDYKNTELKEPYLAFVRACSLCLFAQFSVDEEEDLSPFKRTTIGKPSEVALLRYMEAFMEDLQGFQSRFERSLEMSFNSLNKCSFKVYDQPENKLLICIKGEPECLIYSASHILTGEGLKRFSDSHKSHLLSLCNKLGKEKHRLLAVAQVITERKSDYLKLNGRLDITKFNRILENKDLELQFLGLIALQNPIRLSVPEAIFKCRRAGIKVIMITADHPATALSIAETAGIVLHKATTQLNIEDTDEEASRIAFSGLPSNIFTGYDLANMKDSHLRNVISSNNDIVFARISPENKLRIVNCCRQCRSIVAVTGVGPADLSIFDRSHVRVSLGQYGSDITKRNSDIILLDDNFSSIVHGIEEGRVLFENIKKSLCYTLSSKPAELYPYLLYMALSIPQMTSSIIILAIDLFTDNLPPIALGYERAESHVMKGYPRHMRKDKVINLDTILVSLFFYGTIQFLSGCFAYLVVMAENGFYWHSVLFSRKHWYSPAVNDFVDSYGQEWSYQKRSELEYLCHTVYFITVVITRFAVLFACRTRRDSCLATLFSNAMVNFSIFLQLVLIVFLCYYSPFQYTIRMYPPKPFWWFLSVPFVVLVLALEEVRKWLIRKKPHSMLSRMIYY